MTEWMEEAPNGAQPYHRVDPGVGDPQVERFWASPFRASLLGDGESKEVRFDTRSIGQRIADRWWDCHAYAYAEFPGMSASGPEQAEYLFEIDLERTAESNKADMLAKVKELHAPKMTTRMDYAWGDWISAYVRFNGGRPQILYRVVVLRH